MRKADLVRLLDGCGPDGSGRNVPSLAPTLDAIPGTAPDASVLEGITLDGLRHLAKRYGLPSYQHEGRRLRKRDFVTMLAERLRPAEQEGSGWRDQDGKGDAPAAAKPASSLAPKRPDQDKGRPARPAILDAAPATLDPDQQERFILLALAELPTCHAADVAMHRLLRGRDTQSDRNVLDGRRLDAIRRLRDAEPIGTREWNLWHGRYLETAAGVAALS